jgi:multicomponent K+:H+ antiporter subunit A
MKIPVEVLVVLCLAVGIVPALTIAPVLTRRRPGVLGAECRLQPGDLARPQLPLMMSLGGMVGGIALYFGLRWLFDLHAIVRRSLGRTAVPRQRRALYGGPALHRRDRQRQPAALPAAGWCWRPWCWRGAVPRACWRSGRRRASRCRWLGWVVWLVLVAGTVGTVACTASA